MTMPVTVNEVLDGHAAPDLECLDRDVTRRAGASGWPQPCMNAQWYPVDRARRGSRSYAGRRAPRRLA
jgi:hypothetical protein